MNSLNYNLVRQSLPTKVFQKGHFFMALFLFCSTQLRAQIDYQSKVIDAQTKEPIPFVNIGIVDSGTGTVSDEDGDFHLFLKLNTFHENSKILFSSLGYETYYILIKDLKTNDSSYPEIALKPKSLELNEVVVSNKKGRFISDNIGYRDYGDKNYGYWKDNVALGGELATKILAKSGLRKLNTLEFQVYQNPSDSLLLRVNIYEDDGVLGKPKTNLNTSGKNILVTVKKDKMVRVDLSPFDIYTKDDFIVSLELLQVYGQKELDLILSASYTRFGSFRKYASQDKWEVLSDLNMAYYLETELQVSEKQAARYEQRVEKKRKKQRTLSGFVMMKGKMISNVTIFNNTTKKTVISDQNGRYKIAAKTGDILTFSKEGLKNFSFKVTEKLTQNAVMKSK